MHINSFLVKVLFAAAFGLWLYETIFNTDVDEQVNKIYDDAGEVADAETTEKRDFMKWYCGS